MVNNCLQCNKIFLKIKKEHVFCSNYCREKFWRLHNKKHISNYQKQYRLNKPQYCKLCGKKISKNKRKSGVLYCSNKCRNIGKKKNRKKFNQKVFSKFNSFKKSKGCQFCGYNKCGASLDFHHIKTKERRITAKMWFSNTNIIRNELKKCILLCKNCHYELHFKKKSENGPITLLDK